MSFDYENLVSYITDNLRTAEYSDYEVEVDDWTIDWSGSTTLEIQVTPDGVTVESIDGHYLSDVYVFTRSQLEHVLSDYQPETKEEECVTADDIRYILEDIRLLSEHDQRLMELETEHVVQLILSRASYRKQGY